MKEIYTMVNVMVTEFTRKRDKLFTKEDGRMVFIMEKDNNINKDVWDMLDNIKMVKKME